VAQDSSIIDVLSGKQSIKVEAGIDPVSLLWLGATILVAVAVGVIIAKKVTA
jgi:hypothetical protein